MNVPNFIDLTTGDDDDNDSVDSGRQPVTVDVDDDSTDDDAKLPAVSDDISPLAIDLLSSSDDDDNDDDKDFSVEWYDAKPASKRRKLSEQSSSAFAGEEFPFRPMFEQRFLLARKEQERTDEALARYLQQQHEQEDDAFLRSSGDSSLPNRGRSFDPTTELVDNLKKSDSEYEVVAKVTKELDDKLTSLGFPQHRKKKKKIGLTQKIEKLRGISKPCRDEMLLLQQWRNKLIHDPSIQQLADIPTTKEAYLEKYATVLHMLATQNPSHPSPKQTYKRQQKGKKKIHKQKKAPTPKPPPRRQPARGWHCSNSSQYPTTGRYPHNQRSVPGKVCDCSTLAGDAKPEPSVAKTNTQTTAKRKEENSQAKESANTQATTPATTCKRLTSFKFVNDERQSEN
eukprot:scaffold1640_cov161-Amphora_coffeaeformis.AAC.29